jgi:hypothetical protein
VTGVTASDDKYNNNEIIIPKHRAIFHSSFDIDQLKNNMGE